MNIRALFIIVASLVIVGCSSPITYHEKPTSLKKGESSYYLKNLDVILSLGKGAISGDNTFFSNEEMQKQFEESLNKALKDKGILADSSTSADADLEIVIDYKRIYNYGGKALNKPQLSHQISISREGKDLVTFSAGKYTTKYSYLKDVAVNAKIAVYKWRVDGELEDIHLISKTIADDIAKIGK